MICPHTSRDFTDNQTGFAFFVRKRAYWLILRYSELWCGQDAECLHSHDSVRLEIEVSIMNNSTLIWPTDVLDGTQVMNTFIHSIRLHKHFCHTMIHHH